jgi:hypothetical protein
MSIVSAPNPSKATPVGFSAMNRVFETLACYPGLAITSALVLSLFVALPLSHIPWGSSPSEFLVRYIAVSAQSIAYGVVLSVIGMPEICFAPFKNRYHHSLARLIILILLAALFFLLYPPLAASVFLLIAICVLEIYERGIPIRCLRQPLLPGLYLFLGLISVFGYNAIIVTERSANYSHVLARLDSFLLFGHGVSELAHRFAATVPSGVMTLLMFSYFALFAQIGAALLLLSFATGRNEAMRFVSTILLAYFFSITFWAVFPDFSPYFSCASHSNAGFPSIVMEAQNGLMDLLRARQNHLPVPLGTEYYVSFPCMHITQPLIALWFLRRWRRIVLFLIPIDILIVAAVVLMEWHYAIDLIGGVVVAAAAIAITEHLAKRQNRQCPISPATAPDNSATTALC